MKKESKNLGITEPCPECGRVILFGIAFVGDNFEASIKCWRCKNRFFVQITKKTVVTITKVTVLIVIMAGISYFSNESMAKKYSNCGTFKSREEAQKAFDSDPIKYTALDKGGTPNVVCENYNYK